MNKAAQDKWAALFCNSKFIIINWGFPSRRAL